MLGLGKDFHFYGLALRLPVLFLQSLQLVPPTRETRGNDLDGRHREVIDAAKGAVQPPWL